MQNYFDHFYFGELKPSIRNTVVILSYFGLQLIFAPFKFAVLFGSRNSRNKGHANIKGFTVPYLENDTALACCIFDTCQPILVIFIDNNVVFLGKVCRYYFSPSHFVFEAQDTISGVHVSPGRHSVYSLSCITVYCVSNFDCQHNSQWTFIVNRRVAVAVHFTATDLSAAYRHNTECSRIHW